MTKKTKVWVTGALAFALGVGAVSVSTSMPAKAQSQTETQQLAQLAAATLLLSQIEFQLERLNEKVDLLTGGGAQ